MVSESPKNQKIIRAARRLSFVLNAPWIALHVDDGREFTDTEKTILGKNMSLARDLGAEVLLTQDPSMTDAIERITKQWGVTQIILGRGPSKRLFGFFPERSIVGKIVKDCPDLDVHVIRHSGTSRRYRKKIKFYPENWSPYVVVGAIVGLITGFNIFIQDWFGYKAIGFNYLVGILLLSLFFRRGPLLFASILACISWYYFFIPPVDLKKPFSNEDWPLLILFLLTAIFTGILTDRARKNREMLVKREETAEALYEITRDIATSTSQKQLLESVTRRLGRALGGVCKIILKDVEDERLDFEHIKGDFKDPKERAAIEWVFENGKEAGWSTNTLPLEKALYLPLKTTSESFGVFTFTPQKQTDLTIANKNFLLTVCQLLTNAIEKDFKEGRERKEESIRQTEKVYETVLDLLSEKFTDPFQSLRDSVGELKKADDKLGKRLIYRIEDTSERLVHDIENISSMAKLNAGKLKLEKVPNDVHKLMDNCFNKLKNLVGGHKVKINIPADLPLIPFDNHLMQILVTNLLVNAIQNSGEGTTIEVEGTVTKNKFTLDVIDQGKGIPEDMLEIVFEKFTRVPESAKGGLGLGLSIAREIAEIHGGSLVAENRDSGGSIFTLTLPL